MSYKNATSDTIPCIKIAILLRIHNTLMEGDGDLMFNSKAAIRFTMPPYTNPIVTSCCLILDCVLV